MGGVLKYKNASACKMMAIIIFRKTAAVGLFEMWDTKWSVCKNRKRMELNHLLDFKRRHYVCVRVCVCVCVGVFLVDSRDIGEHR